MFCINIFSIWWWLNFSQIITTDIKLQKQIRYKFFLSSINIFSLTKSSILRGYLVVLYIWEPRCKYFFLLACFCPELLPIKMKSNKYKVLHVLHANYAYKNKTLSSQFSTWKGRYAYDEIWDLFSLYLNTSSCRTYYFIDIKIKLADFFLVWTVVFLTDIGDYLYLQLVQRPAIARTQITL